MSAVVLLQRHFDRVDRLNPALNAVIWQDREAAMADAKSCDVEQARGPLHGIPITVKESFDLTRSPTTWGILELTHNIRVKDSDAAKLYRAAGGFIFGKTNVPLELVERQSFNEI